MSARPPVVAILGHVDHGKTTLLDHIRKTSVAEREHGQITQKIGAYEAVVPIKGYPVNKITFIDTPGHEVFSKLRARGAQVADIAILLIDAKDSVKPQTVESIAHIKSSGIPFIVALNKTDLPDSNPEKVKTDLLKHEVIVEDKGGNVPVALVSAKTGGGVQELLETILLVAADLNPTYDKDHPAKVYVIETKKDRRGNVVSGIIKDGTLRVGDVLYQEEKKVKIRSLFDDKGTQITEVMPSTPFEVLGFEELPAVGSVLTANPEKAEEKTPEETIARTMEDLLARRNQKRLPVIIKTDSQGSLEALHASLIENKNVEIIEMAIGNITKSDVFLARTTKAIIIGFNVATDPEIKDISKQEKVVIKTYSIIYELLEDITEVTSLMKEKEEREKNLKGEAKVLATFVINGETVFGVRVTKGKANLGDHVEVYREGKKAGESKLTSLKIRAKGVSEVKKDQEAGMGFEPALDIQANDMVKFIL